jgi:hypothetical protein
VNKLIISTAIMMMLMISGAVALEPCPLAFDFKTSPPGAEVGLNVQISYLDRTISGVVNEYGEFVTDLGNYNIPNCLTQNFKLTVVECKDNPVCTKTVSFNPSGYTTIDITGANLFSECLTADQCTAMCPNCNCPECVCPECPSSCCSYAWCEDGGFITPEECPKTVSDQDLVTAAVTAISIFIVGLGIGKYKLGVKIYTNEKGEVVKQHKHRNIIGYHSISTMHQSQPHKKGEIAPSYSNEKDEKGKYKYIG